MQLERKSRVHKRVSGAAGVFWVAGPLIAGSDSAFMPWVNILGLILFFAASVLIGRKFQKMETGQYRTGRQKIRDRNLGHARQNRRIHIRYA